MFDFRRLFEMIASTADPDGDEPAQTQDIPAQGAQTELDTPFSWLRHALPVMGTLTPHQPGIAMSQDEVIAWDMLASHGFSRAALAREGVAGDYERLGVPPELEERWRGAYMNALLSSYEAHPECLDTLLSLIREYSDVTMMDRVIECLDSEIGFEPLPGKVVLTGCLEAIKATNSGTFNEDFARETRERLMEIIKRGEKLLSEYEPEGDWRSVVAEIDNTGKTA